MTSLIFFANFVFDLYCFVVLKRRNLKVSDLIYIVVLTSNWFRFTTALTSIELAKQSRELVGDYIDELSADPEKAVTMASDFVDGHVITTNGLNETNGINTNGNHENVSMPLTSSVYAFKNSRQSMEDRHIVIHDLNKALELDVSVILFWSRWI